MKPRRFLAAVFLAVLFFHSPFLQAIEFNFQFREGDKYRIVSTVNHDIFIDRQLSFKTEILTRISMEVLEVNGERARQSALFQSAENTVAVEGAGITQEASNFQWSRDYESEFITHRLGYMSIADEYYMPMVRNVPVFPGRALEEGESWSADGIEVHDFRDSFGIEEPYRIPFTAHYTFLGERTWKEESYPAFSVSYRIFLEPQSVPGRVYPQRIQTASDQIVYWDTGRGQAAGYEEHFRTVISLSDGQTWEYRGKAEAEVIEAPPMDMEEMAQDIAEEIADIPDVTVRITDEGIVISIENIQFAPDSAVLRASELPKLDIIAEILMRYPDRDILVGGHTALAGSAAGRMQLSTARAATVADYFIGQNVRSPERVVIRGYGAEQPIADNRTAEGMARNRRVEITILEN